MLFTDGVAANTEHLLKLHVLNESRVASEGPAAVPGAAPVRRVRRAGAADRATCRSSTTTWCRARCRRTTTTARASSWNGCAGGSMMLLDAMRPFSLCRAALRPQEGHARPRGPGGRARPQVDRREPGDVRGLARPSRWTSTRSSGDLHEARHEAGLAQPLAADPQHRGARADAAESRPCRPARCRAARGCTTSRSTRRSARTGRTTGRNASRSAASA